MAIDLRTEARRRLLLLEIKGNEQYVEEGLKLIGKFLKELSFQG
jgi:hypothetical protein